jgi:DNA-binding response OmpR family regulator
LPTVLIVDDDRTHRQILKMTLDRGGFSVLELDNGRTALETAKREQPDLVLLDIVMPGMGGLKVCEQLKADEATRALPVVMLTAVATPEHLQRALNAGAADYIVKPFDPDRVLTVVRELCPREGASPQAGR